MRDLIICLLLALLAACAPLTEQASYVNDDGRSGLTGKVSVKKDGQPLSGAYVNVYPRQVPNLLGPSTYISSPTDSNGSYLIEVPPGKYYVVARKRTSGLATGPISTGDYFSEDARLLTEIKPGKLTKVDLPMINMVAPMFFKQGLGAAATETGITGILVDSDGNPLPGGFAIAYTNNDIQRLPDFASSLTNEKGEFTLYLPQGGEYYLAARMHAWDMPRPGELYGKYDGAVITPLQVPNKGFIKGIKIVMVPFTGVYKEGMNRRPL